MEDLILISEDKVKNPMESIVSHFRVYKKEIFPLIKV